MATEYEILQDGYVSGPYKGKTLRKLALEGKLRRDDKIRQAGTGRWHPAGHFDPLFESASHESGPPKIDTTDSGTIRASAWPPLGTPPVANTITATAQSPVSAGEGSPERPPIGLLAAATAAGVVFTLAVSLLKASYGAGSIFGIVTAIGLLLAAAVVMMRSAVAPLVAQLGTENPAVAAAKTRVARVMWLGGLGLIVAGVGSLVEFLTPPQGLTRTLLAFAAPNPPEPPPPPSVPALDPKAWSVANFILVNPGREAVAVRQLGNPQSFQAMEFAKAEQVRQAMKLAVSNGVQIIDEKPDLASRIVANCDPGPLPGGLAGELGELWRVHQYLPAEPTLVTFQDVQEGKTRVGFLAERKPEEITLVSLSPKRRRSGADSNAFVTEVVRRADIRTGSQRAGLSDSQVRNVADFLDYIVYRILDKLSTSQRGAGYVRVVVEPVTCDDTKLKNIKEQAATLADRYLKELKIKAKYNITNERVKAKRQGTVKGQVAGRYQKGKIQQSGSAQDYGSSSGEEVTREVGAEQTDVHVDFDEAVDIIRKRSIEGDDKAKRFIHQFDLDEKRLRDLESEAGTVTAELRSRLSNAGVSVLEKSRLDVLETERKMASQSGSQSGVSEPYLNATHVLIAEIRDRRGPDQYHLSTRLVKVGSREIVYEDEGERTPPLSVAYTPPVDTPYLLSTGQLVVVEFTDDVRPRCDLDYASYPGGYPVILPFTGLVPLSDADKRIESDRLRVLKVRGKLGAGGKLNTDVPPILEGMNKRLGFLDDPGVPDPKQSPYRKLVGMDLSDATARKNLPFDRVPFRDLFGVEPVELELSKIKSIYEVTGNLVPEAHRMRFVAFQIAASILPPAGRITTREDGDLLTISLGHKSGLLVSDRLRVLRPSLSDRLDFELQVREVQDAFSRVSYNQNERIFADRYGPQVGDLVHRRADRTVSLAFLPSSVGDVHDGAAAAPNRPRGRVVPPMQQRGMRTNQPQVPPTKGPAAQRNFNQEKTTGNYVTKLAHELQGKLEEALRGRCNVPLAEPGVATHVLEGRFTFSSDKDYLVPAHLRVKERASGKIVYEQDLKFTEQEGRNWKP